MASSAKWQRLQLHFALRYDLGYRYLDRCGEMMILLEEEFDCIPGDTKPTGAKLEQPDLGIFLEFDTTELRIRQDGEYNSDDFEPFVSGVSKLILGVLDPATPTYAGFLGASYRTFDTEEQVHSASLKVDDAAHREFAAELGVSPQNQAFTHVFSSGSFELQVEMKEVTITGAQKRSFSAGFKPSPRAAATAARRNKAAERTPGLFSNLGLLLEVDLRERDPVADEFSKNYELLKSYEAKAQKRYSI